MTDTYHPFLRGFTVAGLSFRTPEERGVAMAMGGTATAILDPEPTNAHDPYAIKLMVMRADGSFAHIGYVPKESSAAVAFVLANGAEYRCNYAGCNKSGYPSFNLEVK